jgi:hypothetical protein
VHRIAAVAVLALAAGCAWVEGERTWIADVPGRTGEPEVLLTEVANDRLSAVVSRPLCLTAASECEVLMAGTRRAIPWDAGDKLLSLPIGVGCIAAAPVAVPVGICMALAGEKAGDISALWLPVVALIAGGSRVAAFCWFPQATPLDSFTLKTIDEPLEPFRSTAALEAGSRSFPAGGVAVVVRVDGRELPGAAPTDAEGWAEVPVPAGGSPLVRRVVDVELGMPDGGRVVRTSVVEPPGALVPVRR